MHEYDSTFGTNTMDEVLAGLDELIAELLDETGADGVDLLGHSLGTTVSQGYLNSSPDAGRRRGALRQHRRPNRGGTARRRGHAGGVGGGRPDPPDRRRAELLRCPTSHTCRWRPRPRRSPRSTRSSPAAPPRPPTSSASRGRIRLSGEANVFPQNQGADGFTLRIFEIDRRTGERERRRPKATFSIGPDGAWGPFKAHAGERYEFALTRTDGSVHHLYFQPFLRSDHLVRLLTSRPGEGLDLLREPSDTSAGFGVIRYKEMWGDQGVNNDTLEINGVNILNSATAPRTKRVNAMFVGDDNLDGVTDLSAPVQPWFSLPFISAVDLVVPATIPPDDTIRIEMVARAGDSETEVVNIPNWATSENIVTITFRDFQQ